MSGGWRAAARAPAGGSPAGRRRISTHAHMSMRSLLGSYADGRRVDCAVRADGPAPADAPRPAAAFVAGAVAVLTTHQAVLWALHRAGIAPWPAYVLAPTPPLGVPALASAAFWGGAWWTALARLLPRDPAAPAAPYYGRAALLGAVLPNLAGALLLAIGRGHPLGATPPAVAALSAALVNGAWGVTAAAGLRAGVRGVRPRMPGVRGRSLERASARTPPPPTRATRPLASAAARRGSSAA